jgi:hypothetical protein
MFEKLTVLYSSIGFLEKRTFSFMIEVGRQKIKIMIIVSVLVGRSCIVFIFPHPGLEFLFRIE